MTDQVPEAVEFPIRWVGVEETPLLVANQFLGQTSTEDIILNFGAVVPPLILPGTLEQQAEQLQGYTHVSVKAVARLAVNRRNLEQLIGVLQQTLVNYDQSSQAAES